MEINYLEIKDRLIDLYRKGALNSENFIERKNTSSERFAKYAKIFLGENIDVSKIDSTNLHEFIRKVLKDIHPDSNNLGSEFKSIASFVSTAYGDIKKNINEHPTFAMNIEYVSKKDLENKSQKANDDKDVMDESLDNSKSDDKAKDNSDIKIDTNKSVLANANQYNKEPEPKDMTFNQSSNTFATGVIPVGEPINHYENNNDYKMLIRCKEKL